MRRWQLCVLIKVSLMGERGSKGAQANDMTAFALGPKNSFLVHLVMQWLTTGGAKGRN